MWWADPRDRSVGQWWQGTVVSKRSTGSELTAERPNPWELYMVRKFSGTGASQDPLYHQNVPIWPRTDDQTTVGLMALAQQRASYIVRFPCHGNP